MTLESVMSLDSVLSRVAAVVQQHSIKCYLAMPNLIDELALSKEEVAQIAQLLNSEPMVATDTLYQAKHQVEVLPRRRQFMLNRGVFPFVYFTMAQWFEEQGAKAVFAHYLQQASEGFDDLGHRWTILFSFIEAWPLIDNERQRCRFIERFTEFAVTSFHLPQASPGPLPKAHGETLRSSKSLPVMIDSIIEHPGFFGHHWITLNGLLIHRQTLGEVRFIKAVTEVYLQGYRLSEDPDDHPEVPWHQQVEGGLKHQCRKLLLESDINLHQITLANAALRLHRHALLSDKQRQKLVMGVAFFVEDITRFGNS